MFVYLIYQCFFVVRMFGVWGCPPHPFFVPQSLLLLNPNVLDEFFSTGYHGFINTAIFVGLMVHLSRPTRRLPCESQSPIFIIQKGLLQTQYSQLKSEILCLGSILHVTYKPYPRPRPRHPTCQRRRWCSKPMERRVHHHFDFCVSFCHITCI